MQGQEEVQFKYHSGLSQEVSPQILEGFGGETKRQIGAQGFVGIYFIM